MTDPDGRTTTTQYDGMDRTARVIDASGRAVGFTYDLAGQKLVETRGVGGPDAVDYATYTYTDNGQVDSVKDAGAGKTKYDYDGFDRLRRTTFPRPSNGNPYTDVDYEELTVDANGNVIQRRTRAAAIIENEYDDIDRLTKTIVPAAEGFAGVTRQYRYDRAGRRERVWEGASATPTQELLWTYDAVGRADTHTAAGPGWTNAKTLNYGYDEASNRTSLKWPGPYRVKYEFDALNRMSTVTQVEGTAPNEVEILLAEFDLDPLDRRERQDRGSGVPGVITWDWSNGGDLETLTHNFAGTPNDVTYTGAFDPARRLVQETISNTAYRWAAPATGTTDYTPDRLNRYTSVGGSPLSYNGNQSIQTHDGSE